MGRAGRAEVDRFEAYLERLGALVGHADRRAPLRAYLTGLLLPGERKSVEPMVAGRNVLRIHLRGVRGVEFSRIRKPRRIGSAR
jgi:SRSO17 transposase